MSWTTKLILVPLQDLGPSKKNTYQIYDLHLHPPVPDVDPANQSVPQRHPLGSWHHPTMPWQSALPRHRPSPRKGRPEPKWMACLKGRSRDGRDGRGCLFSCRNPSSWGESCWKKISVFCVLKWPFFDIWTWFQVPSCLFCLEWGRCCL